MSRNRMRNSQSLHWMGVVKWILITGLLAGLGLCYMICKNQNLHLAEETYDYQKRLDAIEARNEELTADLQSMKSMRVLERRLALMHSTLVKWGDPSASWVRLDQDTRARLARMGATPQATLNLDSSVVAAVPPPAR
ncbi:MAG: hypothetical protein LV480_07440 [Methylacidiphilales bacterium]|nr:hypothetical protein [Candidatus Methylacidiphilales bacterium]